MVDDSVIDAAIAASPYDAAFVVAIETHHRALADFATLLCGDRDEADDIAAEAWARVWTAYRRGHVDDLVGYARRTVANLVKDRRRRRRLERRELSTRRLDWRFTDERRAPETSQTSQNSFDTAVRDALLSLPIDQRAVVVCRHVLDLSEVDTAELLGIRLGTVKSRLTRGLAALRSRLGDHDDSR